MRVLIDTNVLVRLVHRNHPHQQVARSALKALEDAGEELRIVPQTLYEYWAVVTRPIERNGLGFSPDISLAHIQELKTFFPPLRDERGILEPWEKLAHAHKVQGKQAHDARLVAAMQRHGLTHILTFNGKDFERYSGIGILDPQSLVTS
jgi:predicted nucleic acid-binding protein